MSNLNDWMIRVEDVYMKKLNLPLIVLGIVLSNKTACIHSKKIDEFHNKHKFQQKIESQEKSIRSILTLFNI